MKTYVKTMKIYGDDVPSTIIPDSNGAEFLRLLVCGSWDGPQDLGKVTPNMLVEQHSDGSFNISVQKLIPASTAENASMLTETVDRTINAVEDALGLSENSLSSVASYVGFSDSKWDQLMTKEETTIVAALDSGAADIQ